MACYKDAPWFASVLINAQGDARKRQIFLTVLKIKKKNTVESWNYFYIYNETPFQKQDYIKNQIIVFTLNYKITYIKCNI